MEDCCNHSTRSKKCIRKKDKKTFKLPRRFSKKKCRKVRGFTMRSSCAPYKYCKKGGGKTLKNINNKPLRPCSKKPLTGYYRDGYCKTGEDDIGTHTICARMDKQFMEYTKNKGNNLYSVVKPGEKWCLCENRWYDAYKDHKEPFVIKSATNYSVKKNIKQRIMKSKKRGGGNKLSKKKDFLYNPNNPKKSFDVYVNKNPNDTIPIKYKTLNDVKNTIKKLERLYKSDKYTHKRIWQVGMIMYVRLKKLKDKKSKQFKLSQKYFKFLGKRTKLKNKNTRKKLKF